VAADQPPAPTAPGLKKTPSTGWWGRSSTNAVLAVLLVVSSDKRPLQQPQRTKRPWAWPTQGWESQFHSQTTVAAQRTLISGGVREVAAPRPDQLRLVDGARAGPTTGRPRPQSGGADLLPLRHGPHQRPKQPPVLLSPAPGPHRPIPAGNRNERTSGPARSKGWTHLRLIYASLAASQAFYRPRAGTKPLGFMAGKR